jgi:hypothetical protein
MKMVKYILFLLVLMLSLRSALAVYDLKGFEPDDKTVYMVKLNNGDMLTGLITDVFTDEAGMGIKIRTEIGNAVIYDDQIYDIIMKIKEYKHASRIFIMPTAEPISSNHYLGAFELVLFQLGVGISDYFSFTAARSVLPTVAPRQQISNFDAKVSVYKMGFEKNARSLSFAIGGNLAFINHNNQLWHTYLNTTVDFGRTLITANVFYKAGARDYYDVHFDQYDYQLYYPDGSFGLGLGFDSKFPKRNDLHVIGEVWNIDVARPTHTMILLGLRICNTTFSADFGLMFFTQPFVAPFASFVWTPFRY